MSDDDDFMSDKYLKLAET